MLQFLSVFLRLTIALFWSVCVHELLESICLREAHIACRAGVWFFSGVLSHMLCQMALVHTGLVAVLIITLERFLPIVHFQVSQKIAFLSEGFFTAILRAYKRPLSCMQPHVNLEPASSWVLFPTTWESAGIGFFSGVRQFMGLKVAFCDEGNPAVGTQEGSLTRVLAHVRFQIPCLWELLQTRGERTDNNFLFILWSLDSWKMFWRISQKYLLGLYLTGWLDLLSLVFYYNCYNWYQLTLFSLTDWLLFFIMSVYIR